LEPYRRLADLWTAQHFSANIDERQLRAISKYQVMFRDTRRAE